MQAFGRNQSLFEPEPGSLVSGESTFSSQLAKSPLLPLYERGKPARVLPFVKGRQRGFEMAETASFLGASSGKPAHRITVYCLLPTVYWAFADQKGQDVGIALPTVVHLVGHLLDEITPQPSDLSIRERAGQVGLRHGKHVERDAGVENSDVQFGIALHFAGYLDLPLVLAGIGMLENIQESLLCGELDVQDFLF
jgi:hypothetical protein